MAETTRIVDTETSSPNQPPTEQESGNTFNPDILLEEEGFSWYEPDNWYNVKIGEVVKSRYKVLLKLGFGSVSTVWLCRDLEENVYITLKVYETGHRQALNETKVLNHLKTIKSDHPGKKYVRQCKDTFEVQGSRGSHVCIIYDPLCLSLGEIRNQAGGKLPKILVKMVVRFMLAALDYLHTDAGVVHTDIQEGNIMLSVKDNDTFWGEVVATEQENPGFSKKYDDGRIIYSSIRLEIPEDDSFFVLADFGDARFGKGPFTDEVMPDLYRAPEVVLAIPWDNKIDIWALGLMIWDAYEGKHLFNRRLPSRKESSAAHLARMVALLGPPPKEFLSRSVHSAEYFDENGNLKRNEDVPQTSLEEEEENIIANEEEKAEFLNFLKKMLQWKPEDRMPPKKLFNDAWLRRPVNIDEDEDES